ncbi:secreted protein [Perkinsela sp. CCAP 1560/4]|nr:secreted protein [Perkinsela sp. CCAP 1560/4]|eukprot:KNH06483.1 secreted protein [Perkinsela sp. CCAP 1560/4]
MLPNEAIDIDFDPKLHKRPMKVRLLYAHCPAESVGTHAQVVAESNGKQYTLFIVRPGDRSTVNLPINTTQRVTLRNVGDTEIVLHGVEKISLRQEILDKLSKLPESKLSHQQ